MKLQNIAPQISLAVRRISLWGVMTTLGVTNALSSSEGPETYDYKICSRVIDLLYDLSGDSDIDRRELGTNFSGRPEIWKYIFVNRMSSLISHNKYSARAIARPGTFDSILEVYLATDRTKEECRQKGCLATLYYDNGVENFYEEKIEIDGTSLIYAYLRNPLDVEYSGLGVQLSGRPKEIIVAGRSEIVTVSQSGAFIPCPAVEPGHPLAKCESSLNFEPQTGTWRDMNFQVVMRNRIKLAPEYKMKDCDDFQRRHPAGPHFVYAGPGNSVFRYARGDGETYLRDTGPASDTDQLIFATDITADDLWFARDEKNLKISILGTDDSVEIIKWFDTPSEKIEKIRSGDGKILDHSKVQSLIDAMRAFKSGSATDPSGIKPGDPLPEDVARAQASAWRRSP